MTTTDTELMFEVKWGDCSNQGRTEIDRILFGKRDLFKMVYRVEATEMTPEQRQSAIKALTAWKLQ